MRRSWLELSQLLATGQERLNAPWLKFWLVVLGAFLTYTLKTQVGLSAVVSASLTAVFAAVTAPGYATQLYCGAFVGMTSARLLANHAELALAAAVAAALYVITEKVYQGFGGRLGAVAFCATFLTSWGLKRGFVLTPLPPLEIMAPIIVYAVLACALTHWLNVVRGHGPVLASGLVALAGGLILPQVFSGETGASLAVMTMCASFAGMSSIKRIPTPFDAVLLGLLTGAVYLYSMPIAGGAGGKLGRIAFGAAVAVHSLRDVLARLGLGGPVRSESPPGS